MVGVWLVSFLMGSLFGGLVSLPLFAFAYKNYILVLFAAAVLCRLSTSRHRSVVISILAVSGGLWGSLHNPPVAKKSGNFKVLAAAPWCRLQPLVVANSSGVFRAFGKGRINDRGEVSTKVYSQMLLQSGAWFEPEKAPEPLWLEKQIRRHLKSISPQNSEVSKRWFEALFLGEVSNLDPQVIQSFKVLGLFHLLVISGAHIAVFARIASAGLMFPLQLIYATRFLRPHYWIQLFPFLKVFVLMIIMGFSIASGMSAATQRSLLIFVVLSLTNTFSLGFSSNQRILYSLLIQTLIFPVGFFSSANLMSWLAYFFVFDEFNVQARSQTKRGLANQLRLQIKLTLFAAMAFGNLSLIGILGNMFMVPLFGIFYISLLLSAFVFFWIPSLMNMVICVLQYAEYAAIWFASVCGSFPLAYNDLVNHHWGWRWLCCFASSILFCRALAKNCQKPLSAQHTENT